MHWFSTYNTCPPGRQVKLDELKKGDSSSWVSCEHHLFFFVETKYNFQKHDPNENIE